jgi:hypothetical protein
MCDEALHERRCRRPRASPADHERVTRQTREPGDPIVAIARGTVCSFVPDAIRSASVGQVGVDIVAVS